MRNIVLYIASSLDGYIADKHGGVKWLDKYGNSKSNEENYNKFINNISTIIMGRKTYDQVINELSPTNWIYGNIETYILTNSEIEESPTIKSIRSDFLKFINKLKQEDGKDIWIVGGSETINLFQKYNLIDEYKIGIIPVILGDGIKLFKKLDKEIKLELKSTENIEDMVMLTYKKI